MKKIKTAVLLILCIFSSVLFFACGKKPVTVESIALNTQNIVLRPNESKEIEATVLPGNAENNSVDFVLTNNSAVSIELDENNPYKATITANADIIGTTTTFLQVVTKDKSVRSNTITITVFNEQTKLLTPANLDYNVESQKITWDNIESAKAYKLFVEIKDLDTKQVEETKEIYVLDNEYEIDEFYHKLISVSVQAIGDGVIYLDSDPSSSSFNFIQLEEPKNLRNENTTIKFEKVENAEYYNLLVYKSNNLNEPINTYKVNDSLYFEETGFIVSELENEGIDYVIKVQAVPKTFEDKTIKAFPSKYEKAINVLKIKSSLSNFKFEYKEKTLSWKEVTGATTYTITRSGNGLNKIYNLNRGVNKLVLDTTDDKLDAGRYSYTLKVVGNGTSYLDSYTTQEIVIEKLAAPTLKVENGVLTWNEIANSGGYALKINDGEFTELNSNLYSMIGYNSGVYSFKVKAEGKEDLYSLTSEPSEVFSAKKLEKPITPILKDNANLCLKATQYADKLEMYLTFGQTQQTPVLYNSLSVVNDGNVLKQIMLDFTNEKYLAGNYKVYTRAYAENCFFSEPSETFQFSKLNNTNTFKIEKGELNYNLISGAIKADIYVDGALISNFDNFEFAPETKYQLQMKHYPNVNANVVYSNLSNTFEVEKLSAPTSLYINEGQIAFKSQNNIGNTFVVTDIISGQMQIDSDISLSNINFEDGKTYNIKMYHAGGSDYLNSDYSNNFNVKLLDYINDLNIQIDTLSFTDVGADEYFIVLKVSNSEVYSISLDKENLTYSLSNLIKNCDYNKLTAPVEVYITYDQSSTILNPQGTILLDRSLYSGNRLINQSNSLRFNVLASPTNLRTVALLDLVNDYNLSLNELYFDCYENASIFKLDYSTNGTTASKILTLNNGISYHSTNQGVITYKIDTSFLTEGTYNFTISSIRDTAQTEVNANPANSYVVYNLNGFDSVTLNNVKKLSAPTSVKVQNGVVKIEDADTNYAYLLTINGETIYDDIAENISSIDDIVNMANNDAMGALSLINSYKNKERILPAKYKGTFNVGCYKVNASIFGGGSCIKSDVTTEVAVTRLENPKITQKNGIINIAPVQNASSYDILLSINGADFSIIKTLSNTETLSFNIYEYLMGEKGNYKVSVLANTTTDNYLPTIETNIVDFEILETPTLSVKNGKISWSSVENAKAYLLTVSNGLNIDFEYQFNNNTFNYDVMKSLFNEVLESGNYTFTIKALGELRNLNSETKIYDQNVDETSTLSSLTSNNFAATKLEVPTQIEIKDGKLIIKGITGHQGVKNYRLILNNSEEIVKFSGESFTYELPEKYIAGDYNISYQAVGGNTNYLTSNITDVITAEKLSSITGFNVKNGEIYWDALTNENYTSNYFVDITRSNSVKQFNTNLTEYIMSTDSDITSGLIYKLSIKAIGDSYYLNSNISSLNNVAKLGTISDFKIENGILVWTSPNVVEATPSNTLAVPNSLEMTIKFGGDIETISLLDGTKSFAFEGSNYLPGEYYVEIYNKGNSNGASSNDIYFVNSPVVEFGRALKKLKEPTNLNIDDGINLKWNDSNLIGVNKKYILNIVHFANNGNYTYEGIISSSTNSMRFGDIVYYVKDGDLILVNINDSNITEINGVKYYQDRYEIKRLAYEGSFSIYIKAYGESSYLNSDESNRISVILPDPVENLKVENGLISWTADQNANGFILTITRTKNGEDDAKFNDYNKLIYVSNQTYYNLPDVGYTYTINVSAYSIRDEENQTMASMPKIIEDYNFNSFTAGNGTDENPYLISNETTLKLIKYNNFATYKLTTNIVLTSAFEPLFDEENPFVGKIIGDGYKIINLKLSSSDTYSGLLGYLSQKVITDDRIITVVESSVSKEIRQTTEITYISFVDNIVFENVEITAGLNVGVIAGFSSGIISNITLSSGIINSNTNKGVDTGASSYNIYSGSIVAKNAGTIEYCANNAEVYPSSNTGLITGGITAENTGKIYMCENNARVIGTIAGGIVAINSGTVEACTSTGDVTCYRLKYNDFTTMNALAGGIAAKNEETGKILNSIVLNSNFGTGRNGITNSTNVTFNGATTVYIGGLVGENYGECYNNIIKIELHITNQTYESLAGKIFGYSGSNLVDYNYCLANNLDDASGISANGVAISNTNQELNAFDISLVETLNLNNQNAENDWINENIAWKIVENNIKIQLI